MMSVVAVNVAPGGNCAAAPVNPPNTTETTTLLIILRMVFLLSSILADCRRLNPGRAAGSPLGPGASAPAFASSRPLSIRAGAHRAKG